MNAEKRESTTLHSNEEKSTSFSKKSSFALPEEDLLSNLRKSKLFFDDSDVHKTDNLSEDLSQIEEQLNSQANDLKSQQERPSKFDEHTHLATPSQSDKEEMKQLNQRPSITDFLNQQKKDNISQEGQLSSILNCRFFDRKGYKSQSSNDDPVVASSEGLLDKRQTSLEMPFRTTYNRSSLNKDQQMIAEHQIVDPQTQPFSLCFQSIKDFECENSDKLLCTGQSDCLSTKAEPPTIAKNRSNSMAFDFSAPRIKKVNHLTSSESKESCKMAAESPLSSKDHIVEGRGVSAFHYSGDGIGSNSRCQSEHKSPASPYGNKVNRRSFHKQIEMMIDKSESLPVQLNRSAVKLPSPIKEVEEYSQRIHQNTSHSTRDDELINENNFQIDSPKLRQKSVTFNQIELTPQRFGRSDSIHAFDPIENAEESQEYLRVHEKIIQRKPTPYNQFKQAPQSFISRLNKERSEESENAVATISQGKKEEKKSGEEILMSLRSNLFAREQSKVVQKSKTESSVDQKSVKLPLALKKHDFIAQTKSKVLEKNASMKRAKTSSIAVKTAQSGKNTSGNVPALPFFKTDVKADESSNASLPSRKEKAFSNGGCDSLMNYHGNNKIKVAAEDSALLRDSSRPKRIRGSDNHSTASLPVIPSRPLRNTMMSDGSGMTTSFRTWFKNCVFCENEIKLKDDFKKFGCLHKAHSICIGKEKIPKCPRCNSHAFVNKPRTSQD